MGGGIGGLVSGVTRSLGIGGDVGKAINRVGSLPGAMIDPLNMVGGLFGGGGQNQTQRFNAGAQPTMTPFTSQRNADGTIKDIYQTKDTYDPRAINSMREDALRTPGQLSRWGQMAQSNASNQIGRQQAGQLATATGNLAMQGGLRSGARERLQGQNQQSGLLAKQNAYNQIAMQDETNRRADVGNLAGQELGLANRQTDIQNTNIGRATTDVGQERLYDMNKYNEAMRAWAAANTANAMPQTQDKGLLGNLLGGLF